MIQNEPLKIVMFAAEVSPFTKVGGLGDVIGALPKSLAALGAKPVVVTPAYRHTLEGDFNIQPCRLVREFNVSMGSSTERAEIYQAWMEEGEINIFLIGSKKFFDRPGIYDDPVTKEGYHDNMERFIFFMKAGLEFVLRLGNPVDILHCHDSQTALIPGMLRTNYRSHHPALSKVGTLFTIHNLAYQGIYSKEALHHAGIDRRHFYAMSPFEYWNKVNFMKAGILLADKVNTVSQRYAVEIQKSHEFGLGLEGVLHGRREDVSGIVNGIDYHEWNPETDSHIPAHFSTHDLSGKEKCKKHLLEYLGLPGHQHRVPLIGIVSRLTDQKGFDLIEESIREMMTLDLQLVVLGTGQHKYISLFQNIASKYPEKVAARLYFDNDLAHRIEAGSDMFLMPSKFEPCGLNQLYSMRYGTIPIVRATGGLADTVVDDEQGKGTGFSFKRYSAMEMMTALKCALSAYSDQSRWKALVIRAMSQDWSWNRSAQRYLELYRKIYSIRH
jgi:starch synthase